MRGAVLVYMGISGEPGGEPARAFAVGGGAADYVAVGCVYDAGPAEDYGAAGYR